jgi:hypothetical protein
VVASLPEVQLDGTIRRKHIVIGTQEDLPTESSAQAAVDAICLEINQQTPQRLIKSNCFETLVNHYRLRHTFGTLLNANGENPKVVQEIAAPRESQSHHRRLHAGSRSTEARGTEQFGQTGAERRGFGDQAGLTASGS